MNYQNRTICIIILAIIVFIFIYYNESIFQEGLAANTPPTSEANAYIENKDSTGIITDNTTKSILDDVSSKIAQCNDVIKEINGILPRRIEDIRINSVSQTTILDDVGIKIRQSVTETLDPITNENGTSGLWLIDAVLPRGKKGPPGNKGPKGVIGLPGVTGLRGPMGTMGPWGKDCSNNKCN